MEDLKILKKNLISCVQSQMMNPQEANTEELGEVVDMIKDLSETMYYCSIVDAMEKSEKEKELMEKMNGIKQYPKFMKMIEITNNIWYHNYKK